MASWNIPALINKISEDVPAIKALLTALFKWTDAGTEDVPEGAKRLQNVTGGRQIQEYSGSSWGSVGKLMHDVDMLDGKHASTAQTPDTIPVRDANGSIPGNITGNAATATTASSVSNEYVVPIANGGTGATSAANARTNLGTNNAENITQGVLAIARGGTGRNDGKVTDVFLEDYQTGAVGLGQLGQAVLKNGVDCNTLTSRGLYRCTNCTTALNYPLSGTFFVETVRYSNLIQQRVFFDNCRALFFRTSGNSGASWNGWVPLGYTKSNATEIYIAKNGSDAYSGLTADAPVLTWDRAREVARGLESSHDIHYRFGAGEWGTVEFYGSEIQDHYTYISNYSFSQKTTKSDFDALSDVPHFTRINLFSGNFRVSNINVDYLTARFSDVTLSHYNKFHAIYSYSCLFDVNQSYTVSHISGNTSPVFDIQDTNFVHNSIVGTFENGCQNTEFLQARKGCCIDVFPGASWSGTFSGKKADFWCIQNVIGIHPDNFPGTGYSGCHFNHNGNILASGYIILQGSTPNFQTRHTGLTKGTAPSSTAWYQHAFADKNGTFFGGVEHGYGSDRANRINLIVYKGTTTDNNTNNQISVGYDKDGNWFTYTPSPAAGDSSNFIANTWWVRNATGNTNLNAAACRGNAATATTAAACSGNSATASVASKLGTANVGSYNQPIYLENGVPKASGLIATSNNASLTKGTAPSSAVWTRSWITFDSKGSAYENRVHEIRSCVDTNQGVFYELLAYSFKSGVADPAVLGVYNNGSSKWAACPTPPANSNDNCIATTAWVRARLGGGEYGMVPSGNPEGRSVGATYTAGTNGFFKVETNDIGDYWAGVWINGHNSQVHIGEYGSGGNWSGNLVFIPVKKGWTYSCYRCSWCGFQPC